MSRNPDLTFFIHTPPDQIPHANLPFIPIISNFTTPLPSLPRDPRSESVVAVEKGREAHEDAAMSAWGARAAARARTFAKSWLGWMKKPFVFTRSRRARAARRPRASRS